MAPAIRSSTIMPTPPFTCRSAQPTGGGFAISNNLKQRKAKAIQASDQGTKKSAIQTPTISSHTIHPGSASFSRFAAYSQIKQPNAAATRIAPPLTYQGAESRARKARRQRHCPWFPDLGAIVLTQTLTLGTLLDLLISKGKVSCEVLVSFYLQQVRR